MILFWTIKIVVKCRSWYYEDWTIIERILRGSEDHRKSRFVEIGTINLCQRKKNTFMFAARNSREAQEKRFTILSIGYEQTFWSLWFFITNIFSMNIYEDKRNWNRDWCEDNLTEDRRFSWRFEETEGTQKTAENIRRLFEMLETIIEDQEEELTKCKPNDILLQW